MSRQVEFMESVLLGHHKYETGDRATFSDEEGARLVALGWCKCVQTGDQGERKPGAAPLKVHSVKQKTAKA